MNLSFPLLVLCGSLGGLLYTTGMIYPKRAPEPSRSPTELCREVTREVGLSVNEGILTRAHADAIIKRCYKVFAR